jgi:hypothetical protein
MMKQQTNLSDRVLKREGDEGEEEDKSVRSYGAVFWSTLTGNIEAFVPPCSIPELNARCQRYVRTLPDANNLNVVFVPTSVWTRMQQYTMARWRRHQFTVFHLLYAGIMREVERVAAEKQCTETSTYCKKRRPVRDEEEKP